jgi:hypothetical protein
VYICSASLVFLKRRASAAFLTIYEVDYFTSVIYITFSGCSIAAKAVSAISSCLAFKEIAARHDQSRGSLTNLQSFVAFYNFPF